MQCDAEAAPTIASPIPIVELARFTNEFHLSAIDALRRSCGHKYVHGLIFLLLCRIGLDDWCEPSGFRPPGKVRRRASINQLAASLTCPFETMRRNVAQMEAAGIIARTQEGVALATTPAAATRVVAYLTVAHDVLIRLVEDIGSSESTAWMPAAVRRVPPHAVLQRALDIQLMPLDIDHQFARDRSMLFLWCAITTANTRHIAYDKALSARYAFQSTPDRLRRPVSLQLAAGAIGMPFSSARRHAQTLEALGLIERRTDGVVVLTSNLKRDDVDSVTVTNARYMFRKLEELVRLGLDPKKLEHAYLDKRPPLVAF